MNEPLDVVQYPGRRPSRIRKAWCELTGGHSNIVNSASRCGVCFAIQLHCERCGKETRWYPVPRSKALAAREGADE